MPRTKKIKEEQIIEDKEVINKEVITEKIEEKKDNKEKVEIFTQNGKPYKKVTWIKGVSTVEYL